MEQFMATVRAYAASLNLNPSTVIQRMGAGGGQTWKKWESGMASPTLKTVDRVLAHIAANPVPAANDETRGDAA